MKLEELLNRIQTGSDQMYDTAQKIFPACGNVMKDIVGEVKEKNSEAKNSFTDINTRLNNTIQDTINRF